MQIWLHDSFIFIEDLYISINIFHCFPVKFCFYFLSNRRRVEFNKYFTCFPSIYYFLNNCRMGQVLVIFEERYQCLVTCRMWETAQQKHLVLVLRGYMFFKIITLCSCICNNFKWSIVVVYYFYVTFFILTLHVLFIQISFCFSRSLLIFKNYKSATSSSTAPLFDKYVLISDIIVIFEIFFDFLLSNNIR